MNEKEYLRISNLQSVTNALSIIREGILPGKDYGISELEYKLLFMTLSEIQIRLFRLTAKGDNDR